MRLLLRRVLPLLVVLLAVMQLFRGARTNPPVDPARAIDATLGDVPAVGAILERSCNDCHSHRSLWPWYSKVAPVSWLVVHDVNEGRQELNFSEWARYSPPEKQKLLGKICEEVSKGEMPGAPYALLHPNSRLTGADVQTLCSWTKAAR